MPAKFSNIGIDSKTSQAIEKIVFKCLAKEAKHRYQSMQNMITALNQVLVTLPAKKL
jgi:hypothetical protein